MGVASDVARMAASSAVSRGAARRASRDIERGGLNARAASCVWNRATRGKISAKYVGGLGDRGDDRHDQGRLVWLQGRQGGPE